MPENPPCKDDKFTIYDAMSTEELQQILREDASKPVGEESDTDALFYIMEVLAKRRKERNEGKSPEEALESFKNRYCTETENSFDSESAAVTRKRSNGGSWKRGLVAAVAAICIFVVGSSITASALGFDLWDVIAKWTQETFHFGYAGQVEDTNPPSPICTNPCASLQEALDTYEIGISLIPTWLPDGYVEGDVQITDTPLQRLFSAKYDYGTDAIRIRVTDYLGTYPSQVEKSDSLIEIYTCNGIDYYLFDNYGQLKAVWINENYECSIGGPLSVSEIKEMIDSIGKE